jgi:hypothetical protein
MHGTFPLQRPRESVSTIASLRIGLAFAAMPLVIATIAAILKFGSAVRASDIVDILVAATLGAPL